MQTQLSETKMPYWSSLMLHIPHIHLE